MLMKKVLLRRAESWNGAGRSVRDSTAFSVWPHCCRSLATRPHPAPLFPLPLPGGRCAGHRRCRSAAPCSAASGGAAPRPASRRRIAVRWRRRPEIHKAGPEGHRDGRKRALADCVRGLRPWTSRRVAGPITPRAVPCVRLRGRLSLLDRTGRSAGSMRRPATPPGHCRVDGMHTVFRRVVKRAAMASNRDGEQATFQNGSGAAWRSRWPPGNKRQSTSLQQPPQQEQEGLSASKSSTSV